MERIAVPEEEQIREKCGIVGVYAPHFSSETIVDIALAVGGGVQHRGQEGVGLSTYSPDDGFKTFKKDGLLQDALSKEVIEEFKSQSSINSALLHARYGTNGGWEADNLMPFHATTVRREKFALIHNGEFVDVPGMRKMLTSDLAYYASDTRIATEILAQEDGTFEENLLGVFGSGKVNGAYSIITETKRGMYVARDNFGLRPLVIGKIGERAWIAASETHALDKVGAKFAFVVKRGEIARIDENGYTVLKEGHEGQGNFCDFEWAYFHRPDSLLPLYKKPDDGQHPERLTSVAQFRERCGEYLAQEHPVRNASFVVGVPDSGVAAATGYANALRVPYQQAILRDHYDKNGKHRLFQGDKDMQVIASKVLGKLSLIPDDRWQDAIVVVGDDSMVRGNVSKPITEAIFSLGAREVHWRLGFPPVRHSCYLGVSMRTEDELIAARHNGDTRKIAEEIGATSVEYISPENFIRARLGGRDLVIPENPEDLFLANGGCGGCMMGQYPIGRDGTVYLAKQIA